MNYRYPDTAILIFAKAPVAGQVKTRLTPPLKPVQAVALHQKLVARTLRMATKTALAPVILYCSPDQKHPFFIECEQTYATALETQQGDDLGTRMLHGLENALQQMRYVVLIGTDCPAMGQDYIEEAIQRLRSGSDVVIGPANDGGYVLIGTKQAHAELFTDIEWGKDTVFSITMERIMQAGLQLSLLASMQDIDRPEDLRHIKTLN